MHFSAYRSSEVPLDDRVVWYLHHHEVPTLRDEGHKRSRSVHAHAAATDAAIRAAIVTTKGGIARPADPPSTSGTSQSAIAPVVKVCVKDG